jgi:hypothetical protein
MLTQCDAAVDADSMRELTVGGCWWGSSFLLQPREASPVQAEAWYFPMPHLADHTTTRRSESTAIERKKLHQSANWVRNTISAILITYELLETK